MKETGIVRCIDGLGRIVLPKEMRKCMNIDSGDELEIFVEKDCIVLKKYAPCCIFCGGEADVVNYRGKMICTNCAAELKRDF